MAEVACARLFTANGASITQVQAQEIYDDETLIVMHESMTADGQFGVLCLGSERRAHLSIGKATRNGVYLLSNTANLISRR